MPASVLFVCLGNICRSPIAEAIFKNLLVRKEVGSDWVVDSAATSRYELGSSPDSRGLRVLKRYGLSSKHIARQITHEDYDKFDHIICMDENNMADLKRMAPKRPYKAKIELLGRYDHDGPDIIEDPYYGDEMEFIEVYEQCTRACEGLLKSLTS